MAIHRAAFALKVIVAWVIVPLLVAELVVRANPKGVFANVADPYHHLGDEDLHPIEFDPELGWVPRPGQFNEVWGGRTLTISSDRLRSSGRRTNHRRSTSILAAGDSFTFGDWVSDTETWPAYLETMLGLTIHNAGVSSYGFDQTVLRVEQLVPILKPATVIVSAIEDDIQRTTVSRRSNADKPFFRIKDGALARDSEPLRGFPDDDLQPLTSLLRSSAISRLLLRHWLYPEVRQHQEGVAVCCALTRRLAELQRRYEVPIVLLAQMDKGLSRGGLAQLQRCAEDSGLDVIDTYPALRDIRDSSASRWNGLWDGHMTSDGNRVVAEIVSRHLQASRYALVLSGRTEGE